MAKNGKHYDLADSYEPEVANVIKRFVKPGDVVVDAGASIGFFTCLMSKLVGGAGLVLAFEPNLESFENLERNVYDKRNLANVRIFRMALWDRDLPELKLWSVDRLGYTSYLHYYSATSCEVVEARSLDSILPRTYLPRLIKIDCEMAELEILIGAEEILRLGVDCVILEFNYHLMQQCGITDKRIRNYMSLLGYDMYLISITGEEEGSYQNPIRVMPEVDLIVKGSSNLNVMFSTEAKVRMAWKT